MVIVDWCLYIFFFFFFKQKTAYEMRISDWSSDVCSSDLKAKVIACLPENGTAVLNADDPRVMAMADRFAGSIITFGLAEQAALRAEQVRSAWPERLSFTAVYQGQAVEIRTRLCGTHWASAVLAALAVGLAAGIPNRKSP